jgi:hypothetical protein
MPTHKTVCKLLASVRFARLAMQTNATPSYDASINTTGCCPKFNPEGWDGQKLHFDGKQFVKATTRSLAHVPLNMSSVFARVQKHIDESQASSAEQSFVLSRDTSAFGAEHLFAVSKPVKGEELETVSGDFVTRVFEGPYREVRNWHSEMRKIAHSHGAGEDQPVWFFYTTCPKCAKAYGKNYVVGVAEI